MKYALSGIMSLLYILPLASFCQENAAVPTSEKIINFPSKFLSGVNGKASDLDNRLTEQTEKYLARMGKQEERLKKKFSKLDYFGHKVSSKDSLRSCASSASTSQLFSGNIEQQYAARLQQLKSDTGAAARQRAPSGDYLPNVDSLQTSLLFLKQHPGLLDASKIRVADVQSSLDKLQVTQAKLQDADQLSQFIQQRKQQIQTYLSHYTQVPAGITNTFNGYKQQMFYYSQQVKEYKDMLNDPDKMMKTALQYLNKIPAFTSFMSQHSMLAGLFNLPGGPPATGAAAVGQGMPSRDQVLAAFQGQSGATGPNVQSLVQGNVSSATDQTAQLQDKISSMGNSAGGDLDMPDFKPNGQKTRSFFKRFEWGTNLQTVQSTNFFPATSDLGLSLGYKLDDNNRVGIGASYKIGWGQDINHIHVTGQGASIRSFADLRIKKNIFASGGFEYNYQQPFASLTHFAPIRDWQPSALFGISRIVQMKTKLVKSMKAQLLWDALSYQQIPKAPAFKFRIGYSF